MIPFSQTTVAVRRITRSGPYDQGTATTVATKVPAVIGSPSGTESIGGGQGIAEFRLTCDPVDLRHFDEVEDELSGQVFQVTWAHNRTSPLGGHVEAGLRTVQGGATG